MKNKNAKLCNINNYKALRIGCKFSKSTPLILAFHPSTKAMFGKLFEICLACLYAFELDGKAPVTKSTPVGLIFIGVKVSNHLLYKKYKFKNIFVHNNI